jgi:hypothetical protein
VLLYKSEFHAYFDAFSERLLALIEKMGGLKQSHNTPMEAQRGEEV